MKHLTYFYCNYKKLIKYSEMAIVKYVPRKRDIVDRRSEQGGYWEMTCESCGTTFYPTRENAKFCCRACGLQNWRKRKKERIEEAEAQLHQNIQILKEKGIPTTLEEYKNQKKSEKSEKQPNREIIMGSNNVINFLRSKKRFASTIKGQIGDIRYNLKEGDIGEIIDWDKFEIEKISDRRFVVIW